MGMAKKEVEKMEYIDIYDENRNRTGVLKRRGDALEPDEYFMIMHVCIINSEGRALIQQRSKQKALFGGMWDLSAGGFARAGESSLEAMKRELHEELGIADPDGLNYLYTEVMPHLFDDMYILLADVDPKELHLQESEIEQVAWASCEEIIDMIRAEKFVGYPEECIRKLFDCNR